jgi:hypothetical protein
MSVLPSRRQAFAAAGIAPVVLGWSLFNAPCGRAQQAGAIVGSAGPSSRAPIISLVEPVNGGFVPQDRPIVVLHFASGDSADAVDARSFVLTLDGADQTALFRSTRQMAVGLFSPAGSTDSPMLALGDHRLRAHVCSIKGICSEIDTAFTIVRADSIAPSPLSAAADSSAEGTSSVSLIRMLLQLVLALARKLIGP